MDNKKGDLSLKEMQEMMNLFQYFQVYIDIELKERLKSKISEEDSAEAISCISGIVKDSYKHETKFQKIDKDSFYNLFEEVEKEHFDEFINLAMPEELAEGKTDLFQFLGKELHEDFYSDNLSSIMDSYQTGDFSNLLIEKIGSKFNFDFNDFNKVITRREVPLSAFEEKGTYASMRIDIVAEFGDNILLIENKTKTSEHDNQTQRYYNAVARKYPKENIYCLFLAPSLQEFSCPEFKFFSYFDLFLILTEVYGEFAGEINNKHIEPFYNELKRIFFDPERKAILNAKKYRSVS